jgi:hypothetical protein
MANPEHATSPPERRMKSITKAEADLVMAEMLTRLPTRKAAKRLLNLYEQFGAAVAAFLQFQDVNPAAEDIEQQFHGHYFGSYTRDEVIQTGLEIAEYDVALQRFLEDQGLPDAALDWDFDALWPVIREQYLLVQENEYFHVFDAGLVWPENETDL